MNSPHVIPLRINDDQNECVSFRVRRVAFRIRIRCCSNDDALSLLSSSSRSEVDDSSGDDMATRYRTMAQSNVVMHLTRRIMRERPESVGPSASYRTQFQCGRDAEDTAEGHFRTRPGSRKLTYAQRRTWKLRIATVFDVGSSSLNDYSPRLHALRVLVFCVSSPTRRRRVLYLQTPQITRNTLVLQSQSSIHPPSRSRLEVLP